MNNKYCPSCGKRLNTDPGDRAAEFKVVTVRGSHMNEAGRKHFHENKGLKLRALEWVMTGGEPPPAYKPSTVVGRNAPMTNNSTFNLFTGRVEYLLVRNDPGALMRRLLGMTTLRVCVDCYNEKFKSHPQQLQKGEGPAPSQGDKLLAELKARQTARAGAKA